MRRFIASFLVILAWSTFCMADETWSPGELARSPLMNDGELQKSKDLLEQICQFKIEAGQLKIDRAAWQHSADEIEKEEAAKPAPVNNLPPAAAQNPQIAARLLAQQQEREARAKEQRERILTAMGPIPPLFTLFHKIQKRARFTSKGFSGSDLPGYSSRNNWKEWEAAFDCDTLVGNLRMNNDGEALELKETNSPKRTLELQTEGDLAFRLQLEHPDGDTIVLRQNAKGEFFLVTMAGGKTVSEHAATFVELVKQHRQSVEAELLPVLAKFGKCPILPTNSPAVRNAVIASLVEVGTLREEAQRLFAELDSDNYDAREKASKRLTDRYVLFKDMILEKLNDKEASAEVQARLQRIVAGQPNSTLPEQTAAALNLANDPTYVVSLLDDAAERHLPRLTQHLEKITGQKLGADPTAWKQWAQSQK